MPAEVDMRLNFKECNGIYSQLYNQDGFNNIMQKIFEQIDGHLEHIKKPGFMNRLFRRTELWIRIRTKINFY